MNKTKLLVILGPTASGKTARAVDVARHFNGEIISADSRQIYRGMDIGTGKDLNEYGSVPYHMIDICDAGYKYNLYEYLRDFKYAYDSILSKNHLPILCGGTGLYIESILNGIELPTVPENPELRSSLKDKTLTELTEILSTMKVLHNTTDVDSVKRAIRAIEIQTYYQLHPDEIKTTTPTPIQNAVIIGVDIDRENRRNRITKRLHSRLEDGMIDEVSNLLSMGIPAEDLIYYGLEYKFITLYLTGEINYEQMVTQLEIAIHQFAKRQMTWFRGMEKRRGFTINWIPWDIDSKSFIENVAQLID